MPNRILKDSICTSPNVDVLSPVGEVFFYRLIAQCDDYGRMDARPAVLRARCYPLRLETVTETVISHLLTELEAADLIRLYEVGGQPYLFFPTWTKHQQVRAKSSKYPDPSAADSRCKQMISDDSRCNHLKSFAPDTRNTISEIQSNPIEYETPTPPTPSQGVAPDGGVGVDVTAEQATTEPAPTTTDKQRGVVFEHWQNNMPGSMTQVIADQVDDMINTYGPDEVVRAVTDACMANVRKPSYVLGILRKRAAGESKPGPNGTGPPAKSYKQQQDELEKLRGDARRAQMGIKTAERLGFQPQPHDLAMIEKARKAGAL